MMTRTWGAQKYWGSAFAPSQTLDFAAARPRFGIFSFGAPTPNLGPPQQTDVAIAPLLPTPIFGFSLRVGGWVGSIRGDSRSA